MLALSKSEMLSDEDANEHHVLKFGVTLERIPSAACMSSLHQSKLFNRVTSAYRVAEVRVIIQ